MAKSSKSERAENPETPDRQSVINLVTGTAETPNERLVKKHLPAWVISGGLHVVLTRRRVVFPREGRIWRRRSV